MTTMQAFRIHRFGGPEVLLPEQVDMPVPGAGQVRVQVVAASLNPVDNKTRQGVYPLIREDRLPYILGRDFSGIVESVGGDVEGVEEGDAVYAFIGQDQGAFAEYAVVDATALAPKPVSLDFREAGAVPLAGLTAWQGLFDHGQLQRGQRVLIHAASGGVGHFAVQFAKACGAHVIATASTDAMSFVKALGADQVIDYKREAFESALSDIDLVFDLVGGETQERSWQVLKPRGAMISVLTPPSEQRAKETGIRVGRFTARPDGAQLREIGALIDAGYVRVHVSQAFEFEAAPLAEQRLQEGHVRGKMVLDLRPGA